LLRIVYIYIYDQNGYDAGFTASGYNLVGCEVFSSASKIGTNANYAVLSSGVTSCNIHDCIGPAVSLSGAAIVKNNIIAKNGGTGINVSAFAANPGTDISGNTIDANTGSAVVIAVQNALAIARMFNNLITNHVTGSIYGITVSAGTQEINYRIKNFIDYNTFYNNTAHYNAISPGAHDTVLSSNPYIGQGTENYTLA